MSSDETKKLVSYRLEKELVEALKARAKAEHKDQTEIVEAALKAYLASHEEQPATLPIQSLEALLEEMVRDRFSQLVDELEGLQGRVITNDSRIEALEKKLKPSTLAQIRALSSKSG